MVTYPPELGPVPPKYLVCPILLSVASYNVFELLIWIFSTFERRQGLYFSCILTATFGLTGYIAGCFLKQFPSTGTTMCGNYIWVFSYATLLTAHILVLYSRLYLILPHSPGILRAVLIMIIATSVLTVPAQIIVLCNLAAGDMRFLQPEDITETTVFIVAFVRELIIGAIYMVQAYRHLQPILVVKGRAAQRVMIHLIAVQVVVIMFNVCLIVQSHRLPEDLQIGHASGAVVYSIKLKMEFGILNSLVSLLNQPMELLPSSLDGPMVCDNGTNI